VKVGHRARFRHHLYVRGARALAVKPVRIVVGLPQDEYREIEEAIGPFVRPQAYLRLGTRRRCGSA
jgi:hypothetical protein